MRLGIMQPYFAPALGYFDLLNICEQWIVFDTAQYRRKSWMNRNRILHPQEGWQYITARVAKHSRDTPISRIKLSESPGWRELMVNQFGHYRGAPFYEPTIALLKRCLDTDTRIDSLCALSVHVLEQVSQLLDVEFKPQRFSQMKLPLGEIRGPGDWALRIASAVGATEYVNPPLGEAIFDRAAFAAAGVTLTIRPFTELRYTPGRFSYLPTLSIFDVLMWSPLETIREHLAEQRRQFLSRSG